MRAGTDCLLVGSEGVLIDALGRVLETEGIETRRGSLADLGGCVPDADLTVVLAPERWDEPVRAALQELSQRARVLLVSTHGSSEDPEPGIEHLTASDGLQLLLERARSSSSRWPAPSRPQRRRLSRVDHLTERELQVLRLLMSGATNRAIATALEISSNTVRTHVQNILAKLATRNRLEAAALGHRAGLRPATAPGDAR